MEDFRFRINDPEYDRLKAEREARSKDFVGIPLIAAGLFLAPFGGLGIPLLLGGIVKKIEAAHLRYKFKE